MSVAIGTAQPWCCSGAAFKLRYDKAKAATPATAAIDKAASHKLLSAPHEFHNVSPCRHQEEDSHQSIIDSKVQ